jgi:DNA-binding transcriptional LysR family regulator
VIDVRALNLDLDLLHAFVAVAENGGFTAASKRLNLSQSGVSLKIQRLESLLGREVFARTSRSLALTPQGDIVLGYARRLLSLGEEMLQLIAKPGIEGIFRLGVFQQFGQEFLPGLLSNFKRQYPQINLTVEVGMTADLMDALEEDRLDLALGAAGHTSGAGANASSINEQHLLRREPLVWVQSESSVIDLAEDPVPLVAFTGRCGFRRLALETLEKARRSWQVVYSSTSLASIQAAVQADLGLSVMGKSSVITGMKIVKSCASLPALPELGIAIYSRKSIQGPIAHSLGGMIATALTRSNAKGPRKMAHTTPVRAAKNSAETRRRDRTLLRRGINQK